jgi:purine-binding chemotaxis protein CheW
MAVPRLMQNKNAPVDSEALGGGSRKVLTFSLGEEAYGVDILSLKEIRGWSPVTRIPQAPAAVLGVLNLRGAVVPVIDLRVRLGLGPMEFTPLTVIIVLSFPKERGHRECGIVVDKVMDVVDIDTGRIKPAPQMSAGHAGELIEGIATLDDQMLILLNPENLVSREQAAVALASDAA